MVVRLSAAALAPFPRLSLFDSPYPAHRTGRAIDLYPGGRRAPSPVAGTVVTRRRVHGPSRAYAASHDVLTVIDTGDRLARILHVDPAVEPGDHVSVGDDLGRLVRSGYFGPWVDDHVHLEFRPHGADPVRASGSLPLAIDRGVAPVVWDGTGTVVELAPSYVTVSGPAHPDPGTEFAGISAAGGGVLDGGLVHYEGGGLHGGTAGPVELLGTRIGDARPDPDPDRTSPLAVDWRDVGFSANGDPIRGLAAHLRRDRVEITLVEPAGSFALGEPVSVSATVEGA